LWNNQLLLELNVMRRTSSKEDRMPIHSTAFWAGTLGTALLVAFVSPTHALSMKECSAKYESAKAAGTLNGMKWNDFRKAQCGAGASASPTTGAATAPSPTTKPGSAATPTAAPSGSPVFPSAVSPKYSSEPAGRARMHTCRDQYNENKGTNENGGLRWIQKGGGYYSECNRRLKG
jgi:hypothetical protein